MTNSLSSRQAGFVGGNYFDKYGSRNPVHRLLVGSFVGSIRGLLESIRYESVLDVGCASGELGALLFPEPQHGVSPITYVGVDLSESDVRAAKARQPDRDYQVASIYRLPFRDQSFDLALACEVLEHVDDPAGALRELARVCTCHVIVSVPWEPAWRMVNVARGKYVGRLGNTPGHVQWFSRRAIRRLVESQFDILAIRRPFPWTVLLARR